MGYTLNALLGSGATLRMLALPLRHAVVVQLSQGIALLPNTDEFFDEVQGCFPDRRGIPYSKLWKLSLAIADLALEASRTGPVAYVEAEYFGGVGTQASIWWENGRKASGPWFNNTKRITSRPLLRKLPINRALQHLGVVVNEAIDEFETIGLGVCRHTGDWVNRTE